jgi:hypothetical protein
MWTPASRALVPPVEVSRLLLVALVAAGALVSIATTGQLSWFSGGFAAGAGAAFVFSRLRRSEPAGDPLEGREG